ncbi:MAG TPA: malto-oligosyltrehalose synthase [Solirubrobacteraceae bacterium]|nr:malto-oligosyltrehalose synthase [Solirubrobacteraceae bacterium]
MARPPRRATYRLQLTPDFGFDAARQRIPYLRDLGISHLYLSPSLQARPGSAHGYDVVDPTRISDHLGGEHGFRALAADVHAAGLGIVLDLVPNHMAIDDANRYWTDPELRRRFFDIDEATGRHRRFFDIDDLAGVRQEDPEVFEETHALVLSLVREGVIDALRIDHPDGLADPAEYFERLRSRGVPIVWIEKILEPDEKLRDWPVTGTVGYEFLNDVCALFVDPRAERPFTALWEEVSRDRRGFHEIAAEAKLEQARGPFAPDIERLAAAQRDLPTDPDMLTRAVASFPIYRTYVQPERGQVDDADREAVHATEMPGELAEALLLERPVHPAFVTRFQQTTPPVVAKGVEDTAFYRYGRLLALCDVGGDPARFGIGTDRFHAANTERAERRPEAMLTTMTHDTKRSADVRARMTALTWMPELWDQTVRHWLSLTEPLRSGGAPDDLERYFIFQTLAGAWPIEAERIEQYMEKALREAKRNTNWVDQNAEWEEAVRRFCRELYEHGEFRSSLEEFVRELEFAGDRVALGSVALKLTAPGVPDIYQGDEMPVRALVDPDNRRPVDWQWNETMLGRLAGGAPPEAETRKLWLTTRLLGLRIRRPQAFTGAYEAVDAGEGTVAYVRGGEVLVVVGTRPGVPAGVLRGVSGRWRDVLYGDERDLEDGIALARVLGEYGIAVLERA